MFWIKLLTAALVAFVLLLKFEIIGQPMLNFTFRYSDKKISKMFKALDIQPEIKYHRFRDRELRYIELVTDKSLPYVVFIHGAPGSSADYYDYFKDETLNGKVNLIAVDRLGYGYSGFGISEISIQEQAASVQSIINRLDIDKKVVLVGHSYGGPIAVRMVMDFQNVHKSIILLAPALDPELEKIFKAAKYAARKPTSWITPKAFQVAADEKLAHVDEITKMLPLYHLISIPVFHFHGTADSLVPYGNLAFSEKHFNEGLLEVIKLEEEDHFLPWSQHELIIKKILEASTGN